jgi:DNA-binding transcriptional regulator PaaX
MNKGQNETREIIKMLQYAGEVVIALASPFAGTKLLQYSLDEIIHMQKIQRKNRKKYYDSLFYLKKNKYIEFNSNSNKIKLSLTLKGKIKAEKFDIENLMIKKPGKWDNKWRVLIFDIKTEEKRKRDVIRNKLHQWNFYQLQKSVWVCPYDFFNEAEILRKYLSLSRRELKIITANEIEDDRPLKKHFKLGT